MGEPLFDGERSLHVDLQDEGLTGGQIAFDLAGKRAIPMIVHLCPLDELAGLNPSGELSW